MLKKMKPGRKYFIINIDEPYAKEIYEVLKQGQMSKNEWPEGDISFEKWKRQTFKNSGDIYAEVYELIRANKLINAIKVYRQITGVSLNVAKEAVMKMRNAVGGG